MRPGYEYAPQATRSSTPVQRQSDVSGTISPSRQRGYNRLMAIFNAQQVVGLPRPGLCRLVPWRQALHASPPRPPPRGTPPWLEPTRGGRGGGHGGHGLAGRCPPQRIVVAGGANPTCPQNDGTRVSRARQRRGLDRRLLVLGHINASRTRACGHPGRLHDRRLGRRRLRRGRLRPWRDRF